MNSVCVLQNVQCENLGIVSQVLQAYGMEHRCVRTYAGEEVPRYLQGHSGLIVLGGPMSVYDAARYPFISDALRLIDQALKHDTPVLGICLGSQMLAAALGSSVHRGPAKEIGWHPVELSRDAQADALWAAAPRTFSAFHWHGDVFDLPSGARSLARSQLTECQAFVHGATAYGVLFHMEVTRRIAQDMVSTFADEVAHEGIDPTGIVEPIDSQLAPLNQIGRTVFEGWAALCAQAGPV